MIRRPPRSTLFPYRRSSDLATEVLDANLGYSHRLSLHIPASLFRAAIRLMKKYAVRGRLTKRNIKHVKPVETSGAHRHLNPFRSPTPSATHRGRRGSSGW